MHKQPLAVGDTDLYGKRALTDHEERHGGWEGGTGLETQFLVFNFSHIVLQFIDKP